jgi:ATP-dependent Clp protease ATP-binding subunit ClpC
MPEFSTASRIAFSLGAMEAEHLGSEFIAVEHIFLGLCKMEDILSVSPQILGIDDRVWPGVLKELDNFICHLKSCDFDLKSSRRCLRGILACGQAEKKKFSGHRTPQCREAFLLAEKKAVEQASPEVLLQHFLAAVLEQQSAPLNNLFSELGITREKLVPGKTAAEGKSGKEPRQDNQPGRPATPYLDRYGRDLTQMALSGKLEPLIGRQEEIKKLARVLVQKKKNNPVLVGDAGVGKTCIVEGFAQLAAAPGAPDLIKNMRIVELNIGSLVAGTKFRGEFEERLENIVKEAASDQNLVIFIDEIHTLMGAGAAGSSPLDAANILKPALARGGLKCIGATTTAEYRRHIEKDPALERRFQVVWVNEPSPGEAVKILGGLAQRFESHYGVKIPQKVIQKAVDFSVRYLPDLRLPDKAIDIIDQACAAMLLKTFTPSVDEGARDLALEDIARVVAERCRIPLEELTAAEADRLNKMEIFLGQRVFGQDRAISEVSETIRASRVGLKNPRRPQAVFLFTGATGTGKTELAKALASFLFHDENRMIRFDMSEYQEKHAAAKLIGSPPGYVGHEEEGQLTGQVRTNPYSVLLFDEVEKAHPDVFDLFLQIFDDGRLTDSHGRLVNFTETVIIMTSNLGSGPVLSRRPIGVDMDTVGKDDLLREDPSETTWRQSYEEQIHGAIRNHFRPEFLNRLTKTIVFYPLGKETVRSIIDKILIQANQRLSEQEIMVELTAGAREYLMAKGYSKAYGAREMERVFARCVNEPLAQMILNKKVRAGQAVTVDATDGRLIFTAGDILTGGITL